MYVLIRRKYWSLSESEQVNSPEKSTQTSVPPFQYYTSFTLLRHMRKLFEIWTEKRSYSIEGTSGNISKNLKKLMHLLE